MSNIGSMIHDITDKRDAAEKKIDDAINQLDAAKRSIIKGAIGRSLKPAEVKKIDKLDAGIKALLKADTDLQLATVAALNNTQQVKNLKKRLDAINADLAKSQKDIKNVAATITSLGDAVSAIDSVLQALLKLLSPL